MTYFILGAASDAAPQFGMPLTDPQTWGKLDSKSPSIGGFRGQMLPFVVPASGAASPGYHQRNGRHPLRIILLGTRPDIIVTIKNLHRRGFAEANEWSQPIPCPSTGDVARILAQRQPDDQISILTRYLS